MADRKITDLTALAAGSQATGDLLPIVDVSEAAAVDKNKKITVESLFKGIPGDVGIGTTSPGAKLDVNGEVLFSTNTAGKNTHTFTTNASNDGRYLIKSDTTTKVDIQANGASFFNGGNVGVGTTSPSVLLHVKEGTGAHANLILENSEGSAKLGTNSNVFYVESSQHIFYNSGGSTEYARIDSSGRLGLGTSSPGVTLDISQATAAARITSSTGTNPAYVNFNNTAGNAYVGLESSSGGGAAVGNAAYALHLSHQGAYPINFSTNNALRATIDSSGRFLVGASSSSADCSAVFEGSSTSAAAIVHLSRSTGVSNGSTLGALSFGDNAQSPYAQIKAAADFEPSGSSFPGRLLFLTTANGSTTLSERMRLDSSGRLLVGTSSDITGSTSHLIQAVNSIGGRISLARNDTSVTSGQTIGQLAFYGNDSNGTYQQCAIITCEADGTHANDDKPGRLMFSTTADGASSPTERVRINSTGLVQIGDLGTVPTGTHRLKASSSNDNEGAFRVDNTNTAAAACAASFVTATNSSATSNALVKFGMNSYSSGSGQINANGSSQAAFGTFSDERLKENITSLPSQWDNIKNLRPVEFDYIESQGGGHQIGFIAQEFETVYADAVGSSPMFTGSDEQTDEERLTITGWAKTEARLVKALQEAIAKIETLETKVAALEAQ